MLAFLVKSSRTGGPLWKLVLYMRVFSELADEHDTCRRLIVFYDESSHWGPVRNPLSSLGRSVIYCSWGRCRGTKTLDCVLRLPPMAAATVRFLRVRRRCRRLLMLLLLEIRWRTHNLAAKGTEAEWIEEATLADLAGVGDSFSRPRLRAFIQEDDSCAVDNVGLDTGDIQHFLNLRNPDHIMVWWSPYLSMQMKKQSNPINDRWDLSVITWNSGQTMC